MTDWLGQTGSSVKKTVPFGTMRESGRKLLVPTGTGRNQKKQVSSHFFHCVEDGARPSYTNM